MHIDVNKIILDYLGCISLQKSIVHNIFSLAGMFKNKFQDKKPFEIPSQSILECLCTYLPYTSMALTTDFNHAKITGIVDYTMPSIESGEWDLEKIDLSVETDDCYWGQINGSTEWFLIREWQYNQCPTRYEIFRNIKIVKPKGSKNVRINQNTIYVIKY